MSPTRFRHVYGPVPSRRLGRSLGIDLVPYKTCTYDCVYCQLGPTTNKTVERREYVAISDILTELQQKLASGEHPDYISLSGSGEPTLNSGAGDLIIQIKKMTHIPVAVITNGSLLWMRDVQDALMPADLLLPSLDAGDESLFRLVNRPHNDISFERMVDGLLSFTNRFAGEIWLEILLLRGVTGIPDEVKKIARIVKRLKVTRVQLNTVVRPPSEITAVPVPEAEMLSLCRYLPGNVEVISRIMEKDSRRSSLLTSGNDEILSLLGRRPCTCLDIASSLEIPPSEAIKHLDVLIAAGRIRTVLMDGQTFYVIAGSADPAGP